MELPCGYFYFEIWVCDKTPWRYLDQKTMNPCLPARLALRGFCTVFIRFITIMKPLRGIIPIKTLIRILQKNINCKFSIHSECYGWCGNAWWNYKFIVSLLYLFVNDIWTIQHRWACLCFECLPRRGCRIVTMYQKIMEILVEDS